MCAEYSGVNHLVKTSKNQTEKKIGKKVDIDSSMEAEDEKLVLAIQKGDKDAYRLLVKRYLDKIWRLGMSILQNEQEAEDAVQDVFMSLWQSLDKWDPEGKAKFSTWIYRVAFNKCIDIKRARKKTVPEEKVPEESTHDDAYDHLLQNEISNKITKLLQELPDTQRIAMLLYYYEELSVNEISVKLDSTEQSVRSLLKRGRKTLKEKIQYDPAFQSWEFPGDSGHLWR